MTKEHAKITLYLTSRILLMVLLQGLTFLLLQGDNRFIRSGHYWAIHITIVNAILLISMVIIHKKNGTRYIDFLTRWHREDAIMFLKCFIPLALLAFIPNVLLGILLYNDPQIGMTFLLGEIEFGFLLINLTVFPILQGLVELPFYFHFIMPRLQKLSSNKWIFIGLPVLFLSIQHAFMPLRFDLVYVVYRSLMFLPFAIMIGIVLHKRPALLPYLVILHVMMNASLYPMYFS